MSQQISWAEVTKLLSPTGQKELVEFIKAERDRRGPAWLSEIKTEFPMFCWISDLVANRTDEETYAELQQEFPIFPLHFVEGKIHSLHAILRAEIDRKQDL